MKIISAAVFITSECHKKAATNAPVPAYFYDAEVAWLVGLDLQMNGVSEALGTFSLGGSQQPSARVGTLQ
jgi:hypothetical protein